MKFSYKKQKGETLIEVIIAMGILAIGTLVASTMIISTIRSTVVNKNYLIAISLSREGVEAVRAIRDSNWLIFPQDTKNCWNVLHDEDITPTNSCSVATKFADLGKVYYRVNINDMNASAPYKWVLEPAVNGSQFTVASSAAERKFYLLKPDSQNTGLYRHQKNDGTDEYDSERTSFYRAITMEPTGINNDEVRVISDVQWFDGGQLQEIATESILTNYQQ